MKTALCLGGGDTLEADVEAFKSMGLPFDGVIACNDAGFWWPEELDAWVSLHPNKFPTWIPKRKANGYPAAKKMYGHRTDSPNVTQTQYKFDGQKSSGSSGMFTVKVALVDMGFDRVVLAGVPMQRMPHFFDEKPWGSAQSFRKAWGHIYPEYSERIRSMSGWTRVLFGPPKDWASAHHKHNKRSNHSAVAAQVGAGAE